MTDGGKYVRGVIAVAATLWILTEARSVLQPFVIALFVWFILSAASRGFGRLFARAGYGSPLLANLAAGATILLSLVGFGMMVISSAGQIAANLPVYEARLDSIIAGFSDMAGLEAQLGVSDLLARVDFTRTLIGVAGSAAGALSALIIIIAYIYFIDEEAGAAEAKLAALIAEPGRRAEVGAVAQGVLKEIERYMGVRVILGFVQAIPTVLVLKFVGVDAPGFWAAVVFCASFIPTIGTLIGIIFPALMALVQFDTLGPFFLVLGALLPVQLLASNFLEPKLLSRSMNISPLAVFLGIFAGCAVWGIVGALVIVPALAICIIVFAHIPSMRPVAIMLSGDGRLGRDA